MSLGDVDVTYGGGGMAVADGAPAYTQTVPADIATLPDGTTYVAYGAPGAVALARLTLDGDRDPTFGAGGTAVKLTGDSSTQVAALVVQPDGRILVTAEVNDDFAAMRFNPDGTVDASFGIDGLAAYNITRGPFDPNYSFDTPRGILLQPDGRIIVYGLARGERQVAGVLRMNPDGSADPTFGTNGRLIRDMAPVPGGLGSSFEDAVFLPDGKLLFGGAAYFDEAWAASHFVLARYNPDGTPDATFGADGVKTEPSPFRAALALAPCPGGFYGLLSGSTRTAVVHFDEQGAIDPSFGLDGFAPVAGITSARGGLAVQPDGTIVAAQEIDGGWTVAGFSQSGTRLFRTDRYVGDYGTGGAAVALHPDGRALTVGGEVTYPFTQQYPQGPLVIRYRTMPEDAKGVRLDGGVLFVTGDDGPNTLDVSRDAALWHVVLDGVEHTFPAAAAVRVDARLLGGDDVVTAAPAAPTGAIDLGAGNDVVTLADAPRRLFGGAGDDRFNLSAGHGTAANMPPVWLDAGDGNDLLIVAGSDAGDSFSVHNWRLEAPGWVLSSGTNLERTQIDAGGGDDQLAVDHSSANTAMVLVLNAGAGDDRLVVSQSAATQPTQLTFDAGQGDDRVTVDRLAGNVTVTDTQVKLPTACVITFASPADLEALTLVGSSAQTASTFTLNRTVTGPRTDISGGAGPDVLQCTGDLSILSNVTFDGGGDAGDAIVLAETAAGTQAYSLGGGAMSRGASGMFRYSGVKSFSLSLNDVSGRVNVVDAAGLSAMTLTGGRGNDTFEVLPSGAGLGANAGALVQLAGGRISASTGIDTFRVRPDAGADILVFGDVAFATAAPKPYTLSDPSDRLEVDFAALAGPKLAWQGRGSGRFTFAGARPVSFYDVEAVNDLPAVASQDMGFGGLPNVLNIAFSGDVGTTVDKSDLRLTDLTSGADLPSDMWAFQYDAAKKVGRFSFPVPGYSNGKLPAGRYRATLPAGSVAAGVTPLATEFSMDFSVAPSVTDVWVDGTRWTAGFRERLAAAGLVDPAEPGLGARVSPADASKPLPWSNVDRVRVRFDGPVETDRADLVVRGLNLSTYPLGTFSYDAATRTATWTMTRSFRNDRAVLDLNGTANSGVRMAGTTASSPVLLDGEYAGALPSGNGTPGGSFRFTLLPLPGDVDRDGKVTAADVILSRASIRGSAGRYSAYADVNGDGRVDARDIAIVMAHLSSAVPAAVATAAPATGVTPTVALRQATIRRSTYGPTVVEEVLR